MDAHAAIMVTNDQDPASPFFRCSGCGISHTGTETGQTGLCRGCYRRAQRSPANRSDARDADAWERRNPSIHR
jgi:hypothetical protein